MKVIEFTGLPKSGKTTVINRLAVKLRAQGFSVKKIQDMTGKSPVDQNSIWFDQAWLAHQLLDKLQDHRTSTFDVVLINRGIAERIIMVQSLYKYKVLTLRQAKIMMEYYKEFLALEDLVLYLDITPKISLKRNRGRRGRLVNEKFLKVVHKCFATTFPKLVDQYFTIDASETPDVVVSQAESLVLKLLKK